MGNVEFYYGPPRSTKSLRMTMQAVIEHWEGRKIYANYHFKGIPFTHMRLTDMIKKISSIPTDTPASLFIDEIQVEADARNSARETNKYFSYFIAQCGKRDIRIRYASQFIVGAETRLRQITDTIIRCEAIRNTRDLNQMTNLQYGLYTVYDKLIGRTYRYVLPVEVLSKFYKYYDTRELILPEEIKDLEELERLERELAELKDTDPEYRITAKGMKQLRG